MLERLDTIEWASLRGCGGSAADVPSLLRAVASGDGGADPAVWAELFDRLWHQGTVYPASAAAVPFLFELLTHPDVTAKGGVVELIAAIATGEGGVRGAVRRDGAERWRRILDRQGRDLDAELAEAEATERAIHAAVSERLRDLVPYVYHPEHGLPVAQVLGGYPEHAPWLVPAIDAALPSVADPQTRRTLAGARDALVNGGSVP